VRNVNKCLQYVAYTTAEFLPCFHTPAMMITISCAILATPLMAIAVAVSSPLADLSLAPFQQRGSGLHAREFLYPVEECSLFSIPILLAFDVSTPHPKQGSRRYHILNYHSGIRRLALMQRVHARLRTRRHLSVALIVPSRYYGRPRTF